MRKSLLSALFLTLFFLSRSVIAYTQEIVYPSVDMQSGLNFGYAVSMDTARIIIGAIGDNGEGLQAGTAFVYYWDGNSWEKQVELVHSSQSASDRCGTSVAISGDYALVGCPGHDVGVVQNAGAVYVWYWNGSSWTMQEKLTAGDYALGDYFGRSVGIYGSRVVVGAPYRDSHNGSFYVFQRSGSVWDQYPDSNTTFEGSYADGRFGTSVDISGDHIIVGAPYVDSAWIFHHEYIPSESRYSYAVKKHLSGGSHTTPGSFFGYSVSIAGTTYAYAVVGSPKEDYSGRLGDRSMMGAAYVFYNNTSVDPWGEVDHLTGTFENYSQFGYSVSIDKTNAWRWIIVGEPYSDYASGSYVYNSGGAYIFSGNPGPYWALERIVTNSVLLQQTYTGIGVTIARGNSYAEAVVGAPYSDSVFYAEVGNIEVCDDL